MLAPLPLGPVGSLHCRLPSAYQLTVIPSDDPLETVTVARYWESCPAVAVVGPLTEIDILPLELCDEVVVVVVAVVVVLVVVVEVAVVVEVDELAVEEVVVKVFVVVDDVLVVVDDVFVVEVITAPGSVADNVVVVPSSLRWT